MYASSLATEHMTPSASSRAEQSNEFSSLLQSGVGGRERVGDRRRYRTRSAVTTAPSMNEQIVMGQHRPSSYDQSRQSRKGRRHRSHTLDSHRRKHSTRSRSSMYSHDHEGDFESFGRHKRWGEEEEEDEMMVPPSPIIGSFINPIGATCDSAMMTNPLDRRSFVRVATPAMGQKEASYDGHAIEGGDGGWEEGKLLSEEEILYELYGKKGWRYNLYFVTFLASLPIFVGILATTLYLPAFTTIRDQLETSDVWISASVSVTTVASGISPLLYGPLCDKYGRRRVLLVCLPLLIIGSAMTSLATNVYLLIAGRFVMGLGIGADTVCGLGAMTDVWPSERRSLGVTLTLLPAVIAPIFAAPLGGFLTEYYSWRWCCALPGFLAAAIYLVLAPLFPETLPALVPKDSSATIQYVEPAVKHEFKNPFIQLTNPPVLIICFSSAFIMCSLSLTATLQNPILDEAHPGITAEQLGYAGMPIGIGTLIGAVAGGFLSDRGYRWRGDGGRLLAPYIAGVMSAFALVAYSVLIQENLLGGLFMSGVIGVLVPASRPGMYAFAIGQDPKSASAIAGLLHVVQFSIGSPLAILGPVIISHTSVEIFFLIPASFIIITLIPVGVILGRLLKDFTDDYEEYSDEEYEDDFSGQSGESTGDLGDGRVSGVNIQNRSDEDVSSTGTSM